MREILMSKSKLNNVAANNEITFDDFIGWADYESYAFIWADELHRFSDCGEKVYCICNGEEYAFRQIRSENITPVEIVKIDYVPVYKWR